MGTRHVSVATLFRMSKKPFSILGLVFTIVSVCVLFPLITFLTSLDDIKGTGYDYATIYNKGIEKKAEVTSVVSQNNVTVNGAHPVIISYRYDEHGLVIEDHFETMDLAQADTLTVGSRLKIKLYKGHTAIIGMEEYSFPGFVFYAIPAPFFILGIIFLGIGFFPAFKKYKLLKGGRIKEAHIISLVPTPGMPISGRGRLLNVYYYYFDKAGHKHFGEDTTTDLSMMAFYKPEDIIKVAVDEFDETKSCLVPPAEIKRNGWAV